VTNTSLKKLLAKHIHKNVSNLTKEEREKLEQEDKRNTLKGLVHARLQNIQIKLEADSKE
jgi:hypothetical protein